MVQRTSFSTSVVLAGVNKTHTQDKKVLADALTEVPKLLEVAQKMISENPERISSENSFSFLIKSFLNRDFFRFKMQPHNAVVTNLEKIFSSRVEMLHAPNPQKTIILSYLLLLNGDKGHYFHPDGSIDAEKFQIKLNQLLSGDHAGLNHVLDQSTISKIRRNLDGSIDLDIGINVLKQNLTESKIFRNVHHTSKAKGQIGYSNPHGICAGLAILYGRSMKTKNKESFFDLLNQAKDEGMTLSDIPKRSDLINTTHLKKPYELWSAFNAKKVSNRFCDAELGDASHYYLCPSHQDTIKNLASYLKNEDGKGMPKSLESSTMILNTTSHSMNITAERKPDSDIIKVTFYEPNTEKGPIVKYIASNASSEEVQLAVKEMLLESHFFKSQFDAEAGSAHFWIYPFDQTQKGSEMAMNTPEINSLFELSSSKELGCTLFLCLLLGQFDFAEQIINHDIEHDKRIDLYHSKDMGSTCGPFLLEKRLDLAIKLIQNYSFESLSIVNEQPEPMNHFSPLSYILKTSSLCNSSDLIAALFQKDDLDLSLMSQCDGKTFLQLAKETGNSLILIKIVQKGLMKFDDFLETLNQLQPNQTGLKYSNEIDKFLNGPIFQTLEGDQQAYYIQSLFQKLILCNAKNTNVLNHMIFTLISKILNLPEYNQHFTQDMLLVEFERVLGFLADPALHSFTQGKLKQISEKIVDCLCDKMLFGPLVEFMQKLISTGTSETKQNAALLLQRTLENIQTIMTASVTNISPA